MRPFFLPGSRREYWVNREHVGTIESFYEFRLEGTETRHQIAKRVGGSIRHALPVDSYGPALCGARPTGGYGTRGTWRCYSHDSQFGVTCPECRRLEPTPAADASLEVVLARCLDPT